MLTRRVVLAFVAVVSLALANQANAGTRVIVGFGGPSYYHPHGGVRVVVGVPAIYIGPAPTYYCVPASPPPVYVVPQPAPIYLPVRRATLCR